MKHNDFGHWTPPSGVTQIPQGVIGFVYKITDKHGKYYIGCKNMVKTIKRAPLKGYKRKRKCMVDSDWRTYCSSSGKISETVKQHKTAFKFEILSFHECKSSMKLEETKQIITHIYDENCYNEMVNIRCRISKK